MDRERWRRVDELFNAALLAAPPQRAALLERECSDDLVLRREVEALLAAHERGSSVLDSPAFDAQQRPVDRSVLAPGRRLGRYVLLKIIGRGAAGIVYEAQQDDPARPVALKVMRALPHLDDLTPRLIRREVQALARLEHHGIAAIYEAGQCEGWHYFAMERIQGAPITQHARDHDLPIAGRIELMRRVCDAVQYAHQRGVIHRDLKPSNILVTEAGEPKVLDFGLARIAGPEADHTRSAEPGCFHGTLAYASPEQAAGADVDTRSDVYSLGVILFELLTGVLPRDVSGLPLHEAVRTIAEQPPRRLSGVSGRDAALARRLRGDLETIVAKALESEPQRRYASAAALSEDLGRYLRDEPVDARRSSAAYRFWKGVRRHRALVAALVAAALVLSGAAASNYVQRQRAETARDEALVQKELAEQRELLAEEVMETLSVVLENRGDLSPTVQQFKHSLERARRLHRDQPLHIAPFLTYYGIVLTATHDPAAAAPHLQEAVEIHRAHGGKRLERARTLLALGAALSASGDYERAVTAFREALEIEQDTGPGLRHQNAARLGLGRALFHMDDYKEAGVVLEAAWDDAITAGRPRQAYAIASLLAQLYDERERAEPGQGHAEQASRWRGERDRRPAARRER